MAIHMSRVHPYRVPLSLRCTECVPTGGCRTFRSSFSTEISAYGNGLHIRCRGFGIHQLRTHALSTVSPFLRQRPRSRADDLCLIRQLDKNCEVGRVSGYGTQRHVEGDSLSAPFSDLSNGSNDIELFERTTRILSAPDSRYRFAQERDSKDVTRSQTLR